MVLQLFEYLHSFVVAVATVHGVVAVVQDLCMAGPVHVQVCVVPAAVVWVVFVMDLSAAMESFGVAIAISVAVALVSVVSVEVVFAVAVAYVVALVGNEVAFVGIAAVVAFVVVFVAVAVVVIVGEYMAAAFVELVASLK